MKPCLTILLGLFLGSVVLLGLGPTAPFTSPGTAPAAKADLQDHGARDHDRNKIDQRSDNPPKLEPVDRQYPHDYYHKYNTGSAFEDRDRLSCEFEARLGEGFVLDPDLRRMVLPAPPELVRGLAPAPSGDPYVVIGGHVCLIDGGYRIQDTIPLEANLSH